MVKFKLNEVILDYEGKAIDSEKEYALYDKENKTVVTDEEGMPVVITVKGEPLKYIEVFKRALLIPDKDDDLDTKYEKHDLLMKLYMAKKEVELSSKECELLKKEVGKYYGPLVVGRVRDLLK